jgi:hypothetical protein
VLEQTKRGSASRVDSSSSFHHSHFTPHSSPPMRSQPNRDYVSNDDIQTPLALARRLVAHFQPTGKILEPCRGHGNFLKSLREHQRSSQLTASRLKLTATSVQWAEVKRGRDFFDWDQPVDWIITNPPWSQIRDFLCHAMELSNHVVFLFTINHLWTKARLRDIHNADYGIREIVLVDMPKTFPQSGFQLGAVHLQYGWKGKITLSELDESRGGSSTRLENQ